MSGFDLSFLSSFLSYPVHAAELAVRLVSAHDHDHEHESEMTLFWVALLRSWKWRYYTEYKSSSGIFFSTVDCTFVRCLRYIDDINISIIVYLLLLLFSRLLLPLLQPPSLRICAVVC